MKALATIQDEIGQWSKANFGPQQSKQDPDLFLGSLAPLMGMAEELGELAATRGAIKHVPDTLDAIGDCLIYAMDYANRDGASLVGLWPQVDEALALEGEGSPFVEGAFIGEHNIHHNPGVARIATHLGRLFHVTLKRHQGIRGFDNVRKYWTERDKALRHILEGLDAMARTYNTTAHRLVHQTWEAVSARNWKTNPMNAAGDNPPHPSPAVAPGTTPDDVPDKWAGNGPKPS